MGKARRGQTAYSIEYMVYRGLLVFGVRCRMCKDENSFDYCTYYEVAHCFVILVIFHLFVFESATHLAQIVLTAERKKGKNNGSTNSIRVSGFGARQQSKNRYHVTVDDFANVLSRIRATCTISSRPRTNPCDLYDPHMAYDPCNVSTNRECL